MTLNLNGVTVELPNDVQVDVSEDGKYVKINTKPVEPQVVEKIRVVETPGPVQERIRVVERVVEVEKPCNKPHYPTWPHTYPWSITTCGNSDAHITWSNSSNGHIIR